MTELATGRRTRFLMAAGVSILLIGILVTLLRHRHVPVAAAVPQQAGVVIALTADVPETLSVIGTVQSTVSATVRAQLSGTIFAIDVHEGQAVRQGQRLALIDPRPYRLAIAQAEGNLARDTAQLGVARIDLARYQRLLGEQSIARQQVDTQVGTVGQLGGTVAADKAALGTAMLNLRYTEIVAPIAGRVGLRHVDLGNYVTPSDTGGVFTVTVDDPIDVSFAVPQDRIGDLGGRPPEQIAVSALRQSDNAVLVIGHLLAIDNQADGSTGTVTAKARFANAGRKLFPNQFVDVSATTGMLSHVVTVPVSAVRHGEKGDFLFVLGAGNIVHVRIVKLGPATGDRIAILSGVRPGETVVSDGADTLDEGVAITPQRETAQTHP